MKLYSDLTDWYALIDPRPDHEDEATAYGDALLRACPAAKTLLELGAGAGNNAWYLRQRFACTLTDLSPRMLALSRAQNPSCEHLEGDMRTLRLGRTFDTVLVHDAIAYMTSVDELYAAMQTARAHLRPGGVALFAPDFVAETFHEQSNLHALDAGARSMRTLEWCWDRDVTDEVYEVEYVFTMREAGTVRVVHDSHREGLFARDTWREQLRRAGFSKVEALAQPLEEMTQTLFLATA